jgi:hypothetical protein
LDVEITLKKATCTFCCGGEGGYVFSYSPDGVQGQSTTGVHYAWCGNRSAPAPGDSIRMTLGDEPTLRQIHFVLLRQDESTLRGRVYGGQGMGGLSGSITLTK